ncbi:unnamed protein product, partial [Prorocentrum cordatum]
RLHIYTDGSYGSAPETAAGSVVVVDEHSADSPRRGPFGFRGYLAWKVVESTADLVRQQKATAYTAELTAALWALMWVLSQDITTPVEVTPDALNVINLACGAAQCHVHLQLGFAIRALPGLLAQQGQLAWHHINSHIGHPWNELADGVAELAGHMHLMELNYQAAEALMREIEESKVKAELEVRLCAFNSKSLNANVQFLNEKT